MMRSGVLLALTMSFAWSAQGHAQDAAQSLDALRASSVFDPQRRPVTANSAFPDPFGSSAPPPVLAGIITTNGQFRALLKTSAGETTSARPGEQVEGWTVETISEEAVVLYDGSTTQELSVFQTPP